ncbi:MAG TPA: hypothetical protein VM600_01835, partial [Actinomycetota bacterium]|nr:hypothetical protein [Actinomycetota bacterium]
DMQGFYVARTSWFEGLVPGRWLLVSAFRTTNGADEFEKLARASGIVNTRQVLVRYLGTRDIGLGQEPAPDGSGPLVTPLPDGHPDKL